MALSRVIAVGDGVTRTFPVSFALGYVSVNDVTARVGTEQDGAGNPVYRTITWNSPELATLSGAAPAPGVQIVFDRTMPSNRLIVNYEDGDIINDENLNTAQKHALMLIHQMLDGRLDKFDNDIDMGGFRVRNMSDPLLPQDAVTRAFVDARMANNQAVAAAAAESARQSQVSNVQSAASAAASETSRQASADRAAFSDNRAIASAASAEAARLDAVRTAADRVQTGQDRTQTGTDRGVVRQDRDTVAADKAIVRADRDTVAADKAIVNTDKNTVRADRDLVAADRTSVLNDRNEVRTLRVETRLDAVGAEASAANSEASMQLSARWATDPENAPITPGFYSAYHWAQKAREYAGGNVEMSQVNGLTAALDGKIANAANAVQTFHLAGGLISTPKIGNGQVSMVKMADVPSGTLMGRVAANSGVPSMLTASEVKTMLALENVTNKNERELVTATAVNLLTNSNFVINQRSVTGNTHPNGTFFRDRWRVFVSSGNATVVVNTTDGIRSVSFAGTGCYIEQMVAAESITPGTYILSWEGASSWTVDGVAVQNNVPFTIATQKHIPVRSSGIGNVSKISLRRASTPSIYIPKPDSVELQDCRRFFRRQSFRGVFNGSTGDYFTLMHHTGDMWAVPRIALQNSGGQNYSNISADANSIYWTAASSGLSIYMGVIETDSEIV